MGLRYLDTVEVCSSSLHRPTIFNNLQTIPVFLSYIRAKFTVPSL